MRVTISHSPFMEDDHLRPFHQRGVWPANWIACPDVSGTPFVAAFRRCFSLDSAARVRIHVTADERYELFLDGRRIGRGSERGDLNNWFFETYDLEMDAGAHSIVARVWALGELPPEFPVEKRGLYGSSATGTLAPCAQMSSIPGFILAPDDTQFLDILGTGVAAWETKRLDGYMFRIPGLGAQLAGAKSIQDGSKFDWELTTGKHGWKHAVTLHPGLNADSGNDRLAAHMLTPATLPTMTADPVPVGSVRFAESILPGDPDASPILESASDASLADEFSTLIGGGTITIPANTSRRYIVDLNNYYCAYHGIDVSGGAGGTVSIHWAESLFDDPSRGVKGNRDAIDGKYFVGMGDTFLPDGGNRRSFESLWWHAGRYLEIVIRTASQPMTIHRLLLEETRYPLACKSEFQTDDARLTDIMPMMIRVIQMCSHETFMDCPYYEQLMYIGDTRLEALTTYVMTPDARLPKKAIAIFNASRLPGGLTQSRYPSRLRQVIPPFSLWWIAMVRDYAYWRDDPAFIKQMMPGVRAVIDAFKIKLNADGLLDAPNGWNFTDWVPGWKHGIPPDGHAGVSGVLNWQFVLALQYAADLELIMNEPELAARAKRLANVLAKRLDAIFWNESRGLFADDLSQTHFSEHAQCMAILSGGVAPDKIGRIAGNLAGTTDMSKTTIYFSHYLFETYRVLDRIDLMLERMSVWFDLKAMGFKTTREMPEPSRSDCHAWGAHPMFHYYATILGIRPVSAGFRTVDITPRLGTLSRASGRFPHPVGMIAADIRNESGHLTGFVELPPHVNGTLTCNGETMELLPGKTEF